MAQQRSRYPQKADDLRIVGNLAVQPKRVPEREAEPERRPDLRVVPKRQTKQKPRIQASLGTKLALAGMVALLLLVGTLYLSRAAAVSVNSYAIAQKQAQLEKLERNGQQLSVQLAMTGDLAEVMAEAQAIGLGAPESDNCRAVALNDGQESGDTATADAEDAAGRKTSLTDRLAELLR